MDQASDPESAGNAIRFEILPSPAFVDEELAIRLTGLNPGQRISISAQTQDDAGRRWESRAMFLADASGSVDPAARESFDGTYHGRSAMGLFWSMQLDRETAAGRATFQKDSTTRGKIVLQASSDGRLLASAEVERRWLAPGTEICEIRENGIVAQLFLPAGRGPHRVVIVLGGSGGGYDVDKAAILARHGFAALALAYFGIPPLPPWLHRVPLEYFERALACLERQVQIDTGRLGILGISRGAELALLLGATFPKVRAIVAYAPSAVIWGSGGKERSTGETIPCWTYRGKALPFAPLPIRPFIARSFCRVALLRKPVMFRALFHAGLRNQGAVERATIPVEQIGGAILLISGGDDHVWPSGRMAEMIIERLKARGFAFPAEHLHYPDAGHMLRYPFLPTTTRRSRDAGLRFSVGFGGTPAADAQAQAVSWRKSIAFLDRHL